jgi:hypothetical protein
MLNLLLVSTKLAFLLMLLKQAVKKKLTLQKEKAKGLNMRLTAIAERKESYWH